MAITAVETNSYAFGGTNNRVNIVREVTLTAGAAGDVADGSTITAALLNLTNVVKSSTMINSSGQAIDLVPNFARTGFLTFKKGTFTPTDLVFKAMVIGR